MSLIKEYLSEEFGLLTEKLITFAGQAYPKFNTVIIMAGGAGSGKGFIIKNLVGAEGYKFDVDELKKLTAKSPLIVKRIKDEIGVDLPELSRNLKNPDNVSKLHHIVADVLGADSRRIGAFYKSVLSADPSRKPNIIFDTTLSNLPKFHELTRQLKELGYQDRDIHVVWVVNDIEVAIKQNSERDRTVPVEILFNTHRGVSSTMHDIISMGTQLKKYMDGDIVLAFNKEKVDAELVARLGPDGKPLKQDNVMFPSRKAQAAQYIKNANFVYVKRAGKEVTPLDQLSKEVRGKIASYVPKGVTWVDEGVESEGEMLEAAFPYHGSGYTYTVAQIMLDGSIKNKEHMNDEAEVDEWMDKVLGKFANISVKQDQTGKEVRYTDSGRKFVVTSKTKLKESVEVEELDEGVKFVKDYVKKNPGENFDRFFVMKDNKALGYVEVTGVDHAVFSPDGKLLGHKVGKKEAVKTLEKLMVKESAHLTEAVTDLSDFSDSEMIATIYQSKTNGRFGTYKKTGKGAATITLHHGAVYKVDTVGQQFTVTNAKGKVGTADNVEDAAHNVIKGK